jgi:hypothetical protein
MLHYISVQSSFFERITAIPPDTISKTAQPAAVAALAELFPVFGSSVVVVLLVVTAGVVAEDETVVVTVVVVVVVVSGVVVVVVVIGVGSSTGAL